jgi:hypothetical protein
MGRLIPFVMIVAGGVLVAAGIWNYSIGSIVTLNPQAKS